MRTFIQLECLFLRDVLSEFATTCRAQNNVEGFANDIGRKEEFGLVPYPRGIACWNRQPLTYSTTPAVAREALDRQDPDSAVHTQIPRDRRAQVHPRLDSRCYEVKTLAQASTFARFPRRSVRGNVSNANYSLFRYNKRQPYLATVATLQSTEDS